MATVSHKNIVDPNIHEPKGVGAAGADTVYVANGGGSGVWAQAPFRAILQAALPEVSTPSSVYSVVPVAGVIEEIHVVLQDTIAGGNDNITFFIDGIPITGSTISVVASGSLPGSTFSSTPSGANTVAVGNIVKATTDGGSATPNIILSIVYKIKVG